MPPFFCIDLHILQHVPRPFPLLFIFLLAGLIGTYGIRSLVLVTGNGQVAACIKDRPISGRKKKAQAGRTDGENKGRSAPFRTSGPLQSPRS